MNVFRFESPFFLLLIPLAAVVLFLTRRVPQAVVYSNVDFIRDLPVTWRQRWKQMLSVARALGLLLLILALARPQLGREETRIRTEGVAIQMCIDRSGSMQALDFPVDGEMVNRLAAVKHVFEQFVAGDEGFNGRTDDLIGLVAFGGFASALCPPTLDHDALLDTLDTVQIPQPIYDQAGHVINQKLLEEEQATAIGDALALAVERLQSVEAKSKIILLLSDGENTGGVISPDDAAAAAAQLGVKVYTIGVGSNGMAPYPVEDRSGRTFLRQMPVRLDEETLRSIATETDGKYFNATDTDGLARVYREIDELEKTEIEGRLYTDYREMFGYPLSIGLGCLLMSTVLGSTVLRGLP